MIARTRDARQARHLPNIVLTAAKHTPLPLWGGGVARRGKARHDGKARLGTLLNIFAVRRRVPDVVVR